MAQALSQASGLESHVREFSHHKYESQKLELNISKFILSNKF